MSGILDSKTRVLDTFITQEGRRQLADGGIDISYVTFTDAATFYAADLLSGSADATVRIYLESSNLPQDQITFKADELGKLLPFEINTSNKIGSGQVVNYELDTSSGGVVKNTLVLTGSQLQSVADTVLSSSVDNFNKLRVIGTRDYMFDTNEFAVGSNNLKFVIAESDIKSYTVQLDSLPDILADARLRNLPNFKFLPPINKVDDDSIDLSDYSVTEKHQIASYSPWYGASSYEGYDPQYKKEYEKCNKLDPIYQKKISCEPTSRENNLAIQAFEISNDTMYKLDVIDYGKWIPDDILSLREKITPKHFFFVGKLMKKKNTGTDAFIHLFTIIFE
jgi:hypothetical protein